MVDLVKLRNVLPWILFVEDCLPGLNAHGGKSVAVLIQLLHCTGNAVGILLLDKQPVDPLLNILADASHIGDYGHTPETHGLKKRDRKPFIKRREHKDLTSLEQANFLLARDNALIDEAIGELFLEQR